MRVDLSAEIRVITLLMRILIDINLVLRGPCIGCSFGRLEYGTTRWIDRVEHEVNPPYCLRTGKAFLTVHKNELHGMKLQQVHIEIQTRIFPGKNAGNTMPDLVEIALVLIYHSSS
jgi:hypothetical protein